MQLAQMLGMPYREGFVKNRYVGRTFIMPGQGVRKKSVRQKLNAIGSEFKGRNVLLVDDSIVRGTTSQEIVQMARDAGARKVYMACAAPPVRYPNVYGIDMPTASELVAHGRSVEEIREIIGADALIYQDVDAMKRAWSAPLNPKLDGFEASCFDGVYVTGDITADDIAAHRRGPASAQRRRRRRRRPPRGWRCRTRTERTDERARRPASRPAGRPAPRDAGRARRPGAPASTARTPRRCS